MSFLKTVGQTVIKAACSDTSKKIASAAANAAAGAILEEMLRKKGAGK